MTDKPEQIGAIDTNSIYMDRWVKYAVKNYSIREIAVYAEQQRIRAEAAEEMADQANRQAQQAIQQLYAEQEAMRKEIVEMLRERNMQVNDLHERAVAAETERDKLLKTIHEFRIRAEFAENERNRLIILINSLDEALNEEAKYGGWDDFMNLVHKEITALREGRQPDGE